LQEWFLIFTQRVPADEADKILAMLKADAPIQFDLSAPDIRVAAKDEVGDLPLLPSAREIGPIINAVIAGAQSQHERASRWT
jgi:hypothetical protein